MGKDEESMRGEEKNAGEEKEEGYKDSKQIM